MKRSYAAAITVIAAALAFIAWGSHLHWHLSHLTAYTLFPLFGLLAYSLLWSTYMAGWGRRLMGEKESLQPYYKPTRLLILIFILLHPALLIWQLWRDGFGLPPNSYLQNYVAPSAKWAAILGTVAFFVFLAYEFKRKLGHKSWWKYIDSLGDVAMIAIFIHSIKLGSNLQRGWFLYVWWFFGVTLVAALADLYYRKYKGTYTPQVKA